LKPKENGDKNAKEMNKTGVKLLSISKKNNSCLFGIFRWQLGRNFVPISLSQVSYEN
jgi:hypothetical protein